MPSRPQKQPPASTAVFVPGVCASATLGGSGKLAAISTAARAGTPIVTKRTLFRISPLTRGCRGPCRLYLTFMIRPKCPAGFRARPDRPLFRRGGYIAERSRGVGADSKSADLARPGGLQLQCSQPPRDHGAIPVRQHKG